MQTMKTNKTDDVGESLCKIEQIKRNYLWVREKLFQSKREWMETGMHRCTDTRDLYLMNNDAN